jgi:GNAT superfamily N-acetyltransferase
MFFMSDLEIRIAGGEDIQRLIPVLRELRPHRPATELGQLLSVLLAEGYRVIYVGDDQAVYSILGFRIQTFLVSGKTLFVDDLATLSDHRGKGYAGRLFEWAKKYAAQEHCTHFCLNSGFQRRDAYRFYLNRGLFVESMHFGRKVEEF